jgi:hypothetical protein
VAAELAVWAAAGGPGASVGSSEQSARALPRAGAGVPPDPDLHDAIDFQLRIYFIGSNFMVHRLQPAPALTTKNVILAAFITRLSSSPQIATTGIHQRSAVRHLFDDNIAGCPQQIMDSASAAPNEAIKSVTFTYVGPANSRYGSFHCLHSGIYSPSRMLDLCIPG